MWGTAVYSTLGADNLHLSHGYLTYERTPLNSEFLQSTCFGFAIHQSVSTLQYVNTKHVGV